MHSLFLFPSPRNPAFKLYWRKGWGRGVGTWNNGLAFSAQVLNQRPISDSWVNWPGQPPPGEISLLAPSNQMQKVGGMTEMKCTLSELKAFAQFKSVSYPSVQSILLFDSCHLILEDFSQGGGEDSSKARQVGGRRVYTGRYHRLPS